MDSVNDQNRLAGENRPRAFATPMTHGNLDLSSEEREALVRICAEAGHDRGHFRVTFEGESPKRTITGQHTLNSFNSADYVSEPLGEDWLSAFRSDLVAGLFGRP